MKVAPRSPSKTAVMMAVARAIHRQEPSPVLDDYLALPLAGAEGPPLMERLRAELPGPTLLGFCRWACVRARLPEDIVERRIAAGLRQYVSLGAGLDSFAYRRPDLLDRLRVYEVDHPGSQAWKRARLADLGIKPPANLVFAPVDFESQTLREGLESAGYDFARVAVFSWIGVTMYLTREAIDATLATVAACAPGTQIVLTYNRSTSALQGMELETGAVLDRIVTEMGEPFISPFEPAEAEDLMRRHGFEDIVHFGPDEAVREYFPGRTDVRFGGAQRIIVAKVGTGMPSPR